MTMMHEFLVLFWLTVGLIQAHANDDFLFNDEGYPSTASGSISLSDDISSLWSTQDLASDISPAPFFIADDNSSCSADNSRGFFTGRKRIRSIICDGLPGAGEDQSTTRDDDQPATTDPDLEDLIRSLESPWDGNGDGSSASDYNGSGLQRASLCPDLVNIGQVLPVCSSGDKKDVNYAPFTGEVKLEWCTLVTPVTYLLCLKPKFVYCCRDFFPMYPLFPDSLLYAGFTAEGCRQVVGRSPP